MSTVQDTRDEQSRLWNGSAGHAWVDAQHVLDQMFRPFEDLLVGAFRANPGGRVLDVGCGTGSVALAIARRLGAAGHCTGIDISEPMIGVARDRAAQAGTFTDFILADAQTYEFTPESFDSIVSRFGVMFFDDPVRAFANLRRAATHGAELRCFAWRSAAENPFMTTAERAAAPLLPQLPPRLPNAPGQFAFADRRRIEDILAASGWTGIDIRPVDVACVLPTNELNRYLARLGPVGLLLQQTDERTRAHVTATVRAAFEPFVHGAEVRFTAACWTVGATG